MSEPRDKVVHNRGRWPNAYPCVHCGVLTNDHVYLQNLNWTAACDACSSQRGTPWCIECGRNHHGNCASVQLPGETIDEAAARFLDSAGQ